MAKSNAHQEIATYSFWDFEKGKNINVEKVIFDPEQEQVFMDPHRIDYYAIRWIIKGNGKAYIDNIPFDIKPNLLFLGTPSQISWYSFPKKEHLELYILAFNQNLITLMNLEKDAFSFLDSLVTPLMIYPDLNEKQFIKGLFDMMIKEFSTEYDIYKERILASLTKSLLFYLLRIKNRMESISWTNQGYVNLYRQFIYNLENHYKTDHYVADYTDRLVVTEKRLNRACKAIAKETAGTIIQKRIDFEAKRLLFYSSKSVKEIGHELGFQDPSYFNKFFKTLNGETPGVFRKLIQSVK